MTQPDLTDRWVSGGNCPSVNRHRIYILQHRGSRGHGKHVVANGPQMRNSAQGAHDAANSKGVGIGLAQAVGFWHFEIGYGARVIAADLNTDDHKIGPVQRWALVGKTAHRGRSPQRLRHLSNDDFRLGQPDGIDVHQPNFGVAHGWTRQDVARNVLS